MEKDFLHSLTDAVEHEPSGLLGNADVTSHLVAGYAISAIADHPDSHHPLIESKSGILENCSHLEAELLLAPIALPDAAGLDKSVTLRTAMGASYNTIREPQIERVLKSAVSIGEEDNRLLKCMRGLHIDKLPPFFACVKYIISDIFVRG